MGQRNVDDRTGVSCKTTEFLKQMHQEGIHILAVQEGRAKISRHVTHGPFDCIISSGEKGQAGVELWFHTEALMEICGCNIQLQTDMCVWLSTPRILAVSCQLGGLHVEILVGYALQAGRPASEISLWWHDVEQTMAQVPQEESIIFLGDLNCKVGSVTCEGIGDYAADFEDIGGECFRQVCTRFSLIVPSTWDAYHNGTVTLSAVPEALPRGWTILQLTVDARQESSRRMLLQTWICSMVTETSIHWLWPCYRV